VKVWRAVSLGLFGAAVAGTVALTVSLVPMLADPTHRIGAVALLVALWAFGATMGLIVYLFWWLGRE
jgi:hypothetical protein